MTAISPLANDYVTLYASPDPQRIFCHAPGLARLPNSRLVATTEVSGPGAGALSGVKIERQGKIYVSDDRGRTWSHRLDFPFIHARPFVAGDKLYAIGLVEDIMIMRSDDWGESWSEPAPLTTGQIWHQGPANVHYANGCVYFAMERRMTCDLPGWWVGELAPIMWRGRVDADLTRRENWTLGSALSFRDVIPGVETDPELDYFGVPFFACPYPRGSLPAPGRECEPMGWLEGNVVQFTDPDHYWGDPSGRTFHIWLRAHTGGTGYAAIVKVVEQGAQAGAGAMLTTLEQVPSGKRILFMPCPGGQMKFQILFDDVSRLFWLISTQATDSMTRADRLPANRYNLPNNERRRLQLHFSKNCVDWCFAGLAAAGPVEQASRHYVSLVVDGDDLHFLSRSGDARAASAHNGNIITFHTIRDFRNLVY